MEETKVFESVKIDRTGYRRPICLFINLLLCHVGLQWRGEVCRDVHVEVRGALRCRGHLHCSHGAGQFFQFLSQLQVTVHHTRQDCVSLGRDSDQGLIHRGFFFCCHTRFSVPSLFGLDKNLIGLFLLTSGRC